MRILARILYISFQLTWGFIQNVCGFIVFLFNIRGEHFFYHGAIGTVWKQQNSMSMGMFIFIDKVLLERGENPKDNPDSDFNKTIVHEYGHTLQSVLLGPLYLLIISAPSGLWCNLPACEKYRQNKKVSYQRFYPERWANSWGEKITGGKAYK